MSESYHIAVFETKNKAVFLYSILETIGHRVFQLISTPCVIKAGCNYAIRFKDKRYVDIIVKEAKELGIGLPDIYFAEKKDGKYKYTKMPV